MKSWKTTLAGLAGALAVIATAVSAQFDGDPATVPNWTLAASTLAACVGLLFARDNDKCSEDVGAGKR